MARKKQTLVVESALPELDMEQDVSEGVQALLELDGADEAKFAVMSMIATKERPAGWVGEYSGNELSAMRLAQDLGVGKYRIRGTKNGSYIGHKTLTIAHVPKSMQVPDAPAAAAPAAQTSTQDLMLLLDQRDAQRQDNMLKWGAILGPLFAPMLSNLFAANKGPTLQELTAALANMKSVADPGKSTQMKDFMEMFTMVKGITGEGDDPWYADPLKQLAGAVPDAVSLLKGAAAAPAVGKPAPAAAVTQQPTEGPPDMNVQFLMWVKSQLEALVYQAARNKDAEFYADFVSDNLPEGADPRMLLDFLQRPDWWPQLQAFVPASKQYGEWFAEARMRLIENLNTLINPNPSPPA